MTVKHLYPNSAPTLTLNFKQSRTLDSRISLVRASSAAYVDPTSGLVKTVENNTARVESEGLLVEEQRTNVLKRSESMWHSDWSDQVTGNGGSATQSSTDVDPSGNNNALKTVSKSSASGYHAIYQNGNLTNNTAYTFSVYAKANGYNFIAMSLGSPAATSGVFFNLSTGAVGTTNGSGWKSSITYISNGWYRCEVTKTTNNESFPQIETHSADNQGQYTGDGSSGVLLWGAQCEQGSVVTSYIKTEGSTVTRSAEVASMSNESFVNPNIATHVVNCKYKYNDTWNGLAWVTSTDSGFHPYEVYFGPGTSANGGYVGTKFGGLASSMTDGTSSPVHVYNVAQTGGTGIHRVNVNGSASTKWGSQTFPMTAPTHLYFGSLRGLYYWLNGHISRICFYSSALTEDELEMITT